jgi:hypothetical protein
MRHDHPHAVRILGRAWLDIIWKCWTTNAPYDAARHKALHDSSAPINNTTIDTGHLTYALGLPPQPHHATAEPYGLPSPPRPQQLTHPR